MGLNFFLSIIRNFWWRHQIVIWERSIWIVTLQHMNNLTVSFLRQYNRCIIKIATVRFYDVFTIKFCNNVFHDLWSFYVKSSITRWSCSTTMSLGNVKIDTRIWHFAWREYLKRPPCKAFRILSWICTDFCELFCFVHLYKSLNSIQYRDFHSHRSHDRQKVLVDVLDWYGVLFGSKMTLLVWTITLAISLAKSACFLLAYKSINKTAIFLHNCFKASLLFGPMLSGVKLINPANKVR